MLMMVAGTKNAFITSLDIRWKTQLAEIQDLNPDIICLNEGGDTQPSPALTGILRSAALSRRNDPALLRGNAADMGALLAA